MILLVFLSFAVKHTVGRATEFCVKNKFVRFLTKIPGEVMSCDSLTRCSKLTGAQTQSKVVMDGN
jgi:hypothetical protein